jgi:hypothetical protein
MDALSAAQTLDLWEACEGLAPIERTLALASGASGVAVDELAALPLGRRDAWILELYEGLGGGTLEATVACPACGEQDEFGIEPAALLARERERVEAARVEVDGCVVAWRSPDSLDILAAGDRGDADAAERVLLSRCIVEATGPDGDQVPSDALPAGATDAVAAAMLASDPLAEVLVAVLCPACEASFTAELDVSAFVWSQLRSRAQRLLHEMHALARAYGWTEAEALALGQRRRRAYLDLIGQEAG